MAGIVHCPSGHVMEDQGTPPWGGWSCDGRRREDDGGCRQGCDGFGQTNNWHRWRCNECDFDYCRGCWAREGGGGEPPVLLNEFLSVKSYDGEDPNYPVKNMLQDEGEPHCSKEGRNYNLVLQCKMRFQLVSVRVSAPDGCSAPLRSAAFFVHENQPDIKKYTGEYDHVEDHNAYYAMPRALGPPQGLAGFFETHEGKGGFGCESDESKGKFIHIKFINAWGEPNIDVGVMEFWGRPLAAVKKPKVEKVRRGSIMHDWPPRAADDQAGPVTVNPGDETFLFSSKCAAATSPNKVCDRIADAVVDAVLTKDPKAKVSVTAIIKPRLVLVTGTLKSALPFSNAMLDKAVEAVLQKAHYDEEPSLKKRTVLVQLDITHVKEEKEGDEKFASLVHATGFAADENSEKMPLSQAFAAQLAYRLNKCHKDGTLKWVGGDHQSQVVMLYKKTPEGPVPVSVQSVHISVQHDEYVQKQRLVDDIVEHVVKHVIPARYITAETQYLVNPGGRFVIGGPSASAGVSGHETVSDSYGGWGGVVPPLSGYDPHSGGRFAFYAARWMAKSLVQSQLAKRAVVRLSYNAKGENSSLTVDAEGSSKSNTELAAILKANFELDPSQLIDDLNLERPIFHKTATYGHFGREDSDFTWEDAKQIEG